MRADLRIMTPPFNIVGAFALVFEAVYSAYIFMPKRPHHAVTSDTLLVDGGAGRAIAGSSTSSHRCPPPGARCAMER